MYGMVQQTAREHAYTSNNGIRQLVEDVATKKFGEKIEKIDSWKLSTHQIYIVSKQRLSI